MLEIILAQAFFSLKIKISQFPNGCQLPGNQHTELANLRFSFPLIAFLEQYQQPGHIFQCYPPYQGW